MQKFSSFHCSLPLLFWGAEMLWQICFWKIMILPWFEALHSLIKLVKILTFVVFVQVTGPCEKMGDRWPKLLEANAALVMLKTNPDKIIPKDALFGS